MRLEMLVEALPSFYDDLAGCLAELWRSLDGGVRDRRSPFHTPTLATVDALGWPRARTVVLRAASRDGASLRIHCDRRSRKAAEVAATARAALHAYDPAAKIQIRVEGEATLHTDDAVADAAWAGAQAMSRIGYGIEPAPGTALPAGGAYALPENEATAAGRAHFGALVLRAERLDFLVLDRRGHRRAAWERDGTRWSGRWLAP